MNSPANHLWGGGRSAMIRLGLLLAVFGGISGCAALIVRPVLAPLSFSLQRQTDLELVRSGLPSFLLMIDGLILANPHDRQLLISGVQAYVFYAAVQFEDGAAARAAVVSEKARDYGQDLLRRLCGDELPRRLADLADCLQRVDQKDVAALFWGGYGWASWLGYQDGAPAALADLPRVEQIMQRVLALDEAFYHGAAHLFLGAYYAARPPMLGGQPEQSRQHFERALVLGQRRFLPAQVLYAETYARLTADRPLFERLLREVLAQPLPADELASTNKLAKARAGRLLDRIDDYF